MVLNLYYIFMKMRLTLDYWKSCCLGYFNVDVDLNFDKTNKSFIDKYNVIGFTGDFPINWVIWF